MQVNETQESCLKARQSLSICRKRGDARVAEPSGRSCLLTRDQVEHWQWLSVYELGMLIKMMFKKKETNPPCSRFPPPTSLPVSLIDWLTDLYCHGSTADSDLHTYITLYVLGWMAAACVNSAWGRCPRVCVSQITFTRRCSSRLPAPAPSRYHIKRIWMWLNSVTGETVGARHAWLMSSLQH